MTQPAFDFSVRLTAPACLPVVERRRLSAQCAAILARLEQGPATNGELAAVALKYTSRLSDLRAAGYRIEAGPRDHRTGVVVYRLVGEKTC